MRKSREETVGTRARIVEAAAAQLREHGIGGTSLTDLMGAVGMTHGGFYKHFVSKEQVVYEAAEFALIERRHAFEAYARGQPTGEQFAALVTAYLSLDHCVTPAGGCLLAALGSEITRSSPATKELVMQQSLEFAALIEDFLDPARSDRHGCALAVVSAIVGALTLARIAPDAALAEKILASARIHILANWA